MTAEHHTIPMNQRLVETHETLKIVDNQPDWVFHKEDGMCFGDVKKVDVGSRAAGFTQTSHNFTHSA